MLIEANKRDLAEILRGTSEIYGKAPPSQLLMRMFFSALQRFDMDQIEAAFTIHVKSSKFMPTIADIVELIESTHPAIQRPGADEAWAMISHLTENDCVVWTNEMNEAYAVAAPLIHDGEKVAARMAFREAYNRAVFNAKASGQAVTWFLSRGHSSEGLESVIQEAMRLGRLSTDAGSALLLEAGYKSPINLSNLLAGPPESSEASSKAKESILKLKEMLRGIRHADS